MSQAGAIRAGRAYVEFYGDKSRLLAETKSVKIMMKDLQKDVANSGRKIALLGGSILAAFIPAIKLASDAEETMSKFRVVFGAAADDAEKWADVLGGQIKRSKTEIKGFLAGTQDLLVPIGIDPVAAEDMSKTIVKLGYDLASFNNMVDSDAIRDLHAALTGSGEVMKKYGVIVSETAVKQELLNQGMDPKIATEQQKVMARLAIILRGTTAAQGDAARTSGGFANTMKGLKAELRDAGEAVGTALLPVLTELVSSVAEAVTGFAEWAREHKELIVLFVKAAALLTAIGGGMMLVGKAITIVSTLVKAVILPLKILNAVFLLLSANPVVLILGVIAAAIGGLIYLVTKLRNTESEANEKKLKQLEEEVRKRKEVAEAAKKQQAQADKARQAADEQRRKIIAAGFAFFEGQSETPGAAQRQRISDEFDKVDAALRQRFDAGVISLEQLESKLQDIYWLSQAAKNRTYDAEADAQGRRLAEAWQTGLENFKTRSGTDGIIAEYAYRQERARNKLERLKASGSQDGLTQLSIRDLQKVANMDLATFIKTASEGRYSLDSLMAPDRPGATFATFNAAAVGQMGVSGVVERNLKANEKTAENTKHIKDHLANTVNVFG